MKANYFRFGVFLIVATGLLVAAIVILGAGVFEPAGEYYETHFDRSVTGLSPGASLEVQGVKIGQVESIGFVSDAYEIPPDLAATLGGIRLVRVVFSVAPRFAKGGTGPDRQARYRRELHSGLRVRLESNLITGRAYLQGIYVDPNRFPASEPPWQTEYPYVPSVPSQFASLTESLDRILTKIETLDVQTLLAHLDDLILTADQAIEGADIPRLRQQANGLLMDVRSKIQTIDMEKIGRQVERLMTNADGAVTEVRATNEHLQTLLARPATDKELANIPMVVDELNTTLRRLSLLIATQAPRIESALENFRKVSSDVSELSADLKRTPSDLLLSSPPRKSELVK
jgi:phospholipid/cholesterol/gamma-HCH transport system substrate-binding protein/paraquat-inducible protein B